MDQIKISIFAFLLLLFQNCSDKVVPPIGIDPLPSEAQLNYQKMEYNGFIHFNMNTFSNMEWGYGDEKPSQFNPSALDARQWARIMKDAGMKGIIITAKHHDGFCLWPSQFTEHSVKNSPWQQGKGDVLKDLSEACKEYGLKFGVYLSPWDRNHADYGKPEYITYFRNQLRELLTNYGEIFEVWFDGANGGDGYYGGSNEIRKVDKLNYYDWENTYKLVYELQPNAIIFSDAGPGCRWIGNENGFSYPTTWSPLLKDSVYGGMPEYGEKYSMGQENGTHWVPGEADVSIRPGWYYHEYEDHKVKSISELLEIYYRSIGQNSTLLLNFPVDKRGLIHENDEVQVMKLAAKIKEDFANNLALSAICSASNERGTTFHASNITDGNNETYWATDDSIINASIAIDFKNEIVFNRIVLQEYIRLGQRIQKFKIEAKRGDNWETIADETTIGYKRILRLKDTKTSSIRLTVEKAKACPTISNFEVFLAPKLLIPPLISRDRKGLVNIMMPEEGVKIFYTLDGSVPTTLSEVYSGEILLPRGGTIKAIAEYDDRVSEVAEVRFDISSGNWNIIGDDENLIKAIDGNPDTWMSNKTTENDELAINLNEKLNLKGFTYLPTQQRYVTGFISQYEFYTSMDGKKWYLAKKGEFGNIENSPILQTVNFDPIEAKFIKLKVIKTVDGNPGSFAEVGIITI